MLAGTETWSTWEELLLGGAVLRHGTNDWDAVAAELRSRTTYPYAFTPPVCKAKYKDLQQRYSGCKAWFEELRKRRVAELKQALEQSEDSIGCLKTKLETLKSAKGEHCHIDHDSNQTKSPVPFQKLEGSDSFGKEASKDGLSAGSFTQETRSNWSPRSHPPAAVSSEETDAKPEVSESSEREKVSEPFQREKALDSSKQAQASSIETFCGRQMKGMRKRRGKRKRKDCNILGPATGVATESQCKESSALDSCHVARESSSMKDSSLGFMRGADLMSIFDSVAETQSAYTFRHRLNSQKRARYKKLIRRHLDFEAIRTAILNQSITTLRELFRDLLLLANNASIFYSKRSREHKAAKLLRDLVTKSMRRHCEANDKPHKAATIAAAPMLPTLPLGVNRPVKPRSTRPCKHRKLPGKVINADDNIAAGASQGDRKPSINFPPPPPPPAKKGSGHQGRSRRGGVQLLATAAKRGKGRGRP